MEIEPQKLIILASFFSGMLLGIAGESIARTRAIQRNKERMSQYDLWLPVKVRFKIFRTILKHGIIFSIPVSIAKLTPINGIEDPSIYFGAGLAAGGLLTDFFLPPDEVRIISLDDFLDSDYEI